MERDEKYAPSDSEDEGRRQQPPPEEEIAVLPTAPPAEERPVSEPRRSRSGSGLRRSQGMSDLSDNEADESNARSGRRSGAKPGTLPYNTMGQIVSLVMTSLLQVVEIAKSQGATIELPNLEEMIDLAGRIKSGPPSVAGPELERPEPRRAESGEDQMAMFARRVFLQPRRPDQVVKTPCPSSFTDETRLATKRDRSSHAIKQYFGQPKVFSGSGHAREPKIVELLCEVTRAQEYLCLPLKEFLDILARKFTGDAWELVHSWRQTDGDDVESIYENLLAFYDNRPKPQEAMDQMQELKAVNYKSLAGIVKDIDLLSGRACLLESCPKMQEMVREHLSKMTLVKLIPSSVRHQVKHDLESLECTLGKGKVSYRDAVLVAKKHRVLIDQGLAATYKPRYADRPQADKNQNQRPQTNNSNRPQATVRQLDAERPALSPVDASTGARSKTSNNPNKNKTPNKSPGNQGGQQNSGHAHKGRKENLVDYDPNSGKEPRFESQAGTKRCPKCQTTGHAPGECPIKGPVAPRPCSLCVLEGLHYEKNCVFAQAERFRKALAGPSADKKDKDSKGN